MTGGVNESRVEELAREKLAGKSYSTIRKELEESGMGEEEISSLIRKVDARVLGETVQQGRQEKKRRLYRTGLFLAIACLALSIAYNRGIIFQTLPALLVYTPFFLGIIIMVYARYLLKNRSSPPDSHTGAIRRRRPYK